MAILIAESLCKQYQTGNTIVDALVDINIHVEQGEFVAVMGPSGSGKSTLLHLLGGMDSPSQGEVILAGQHYSQLSDKQMTLIRRRRIGFIFQFFNLLPTLTAGENVMLPLLIDGKSRNKYRERANELLKLVNLSDREKHKPEQLSGGEQQRVAIARALATDPDVILADEMTGNLNSRAGEEVLALLRRACDDRGQTIIMVTHDPRASRYADRILFLKDGCIAGETSLEDNADSKIILERLAELEI